MESYTRMFDRREYKTEPWSDWLTDDAVLMKADGGEVKGGEAAWVANQELFTPFTEYFHIPYYGVFTETDYGWELIAQAWLFANLPGKRGDDEPPQVTDPRDGKKWDVRVPGAFRFQYAKGKGKTGMAVQRSDLHVDSMPASMILIKRGVMKLG